MIATVVTPVGAAVHVQHPMQMSTPTTAAAEVTQCQQAQMVVDHLLAAAMVRIDAARQTNAAVDLRAAVDSLQTTLRDARAQLAPCASVAATGDAHAGHTMPTQTPAPGAAPSQVPVDPHAGHNMSPQTPASAPATRAPVRAPAPAPAPPDPHAGHVMPPSTGSAKPAPPPPPMDHSKMDMGAKAKPARGTKPAAGPKPAPPPAAIDHSKMDMGAAAKPAPPAGAPAQVSDPVCGMKVDPAGAPQATHQGKTYHFCSEQHRELFQKTPTKYLPKGN
ncbi:MAG TPA: YHS domain-containing protein [Vicinamibacterales bacterium]|nr:YHS domain-containing protein [Vicinamibacterales bacterium]